MSNHGAICIDVRIRLTVKDKFVKLQALKIPIHVSHAGQHINYTKKGVLQELLGDVWNAKLISISTDGARKMTGKVVGGSTKI